MDYLVDKSFNTELFTPSTVMKSSIAELCVVSISWPRELFVKMAGRNTEVKEKFAIFIYFIFVSNLRFHFSFY